jgi:TusA-related sulfurtransferase
MNEQELIADGERIKAFLEDPAVQRALKAIEEKAMKEIVEAKQPEDLAGPWARLKAVTEFQAELRVTIDRGIYAARQQKAQSPAPRRR